MPTTLSDQALDSARRMVSVADNYFTLGAELLRGSNDALREGDAHKALNLKKQAYRALDGSRCMYGRGSPACGAREERRRKSIVAVVCVSVFAFDPIPLPGGGGRAQVAHDFNSRTLMERGRVAVRRHQLTKAVTRKVTAAEMARPILDKEGVWQDSIGYVVTGERRAVVELWKNFLRNSCHCVAGWRSVELLAGLPELFKSQSKRISEAFAQASPA